MRVLLPVLLALFSGATAAAAAPQTASVSVTRGPIREPRKLKDVKVQYPDLAALARVQGVVILECTISAEGLVGDVKVLRRVHPLLDEAAVDAVRQWVYAPTLLNGKPVPVIVTVRVNFRLGGVPQGNAPASNQGALGVEREAELRRLVRALRIEAIEPREFEALVEFQRKLQPEVPGEVWEALRAEYPAGELEAAVLRALDVSLGPDDVRAATSFYESDAGRHLLGAQSRMGQEEMAICQKWMERVLEGLPERLKKAGVKTTD